MHQSSTFIALLAACGSDAGSPADAGVDAPSSTDDASSNASHDSGQDAGTSDDFCGRGACLGRDCTTFEVEAEASITLDPSGALVLAAGASYGEWRHIFEDPCVAYGAAVMWRSVTLDGALEGVTLAVRGASTLGDLEGAAWHLVQPGEELPEVNTGGCGARFLEVQLLLDVSGTVTPRVEQLEVCHGCTSIFC